MTVRLLLVSNLAPGTTRKGKEATTGPLQLVESNSMPREGKDLVL